MINKRLLIKNLISHNGEGTFFDKKRSISLSSDSEKAKLLKHICALSNSNPENESYIIFGISDDDNSIIGTSAFDDSVIQNLVRSNLENPPIVSYENIQFPETKYYQTVGLLTIFPNAEKTSLIKNIWKLKKGSSFYRYGSTSIIIDENFYVNETNKLTVSAIKEYSINNLKGLIDGVQEFKSISHPEYHPENVVFLDQFVLCWSAWRDKYGERDYYSEINIHLVNENKKIFISAVQFADIIITEKEFKIIELVPLGYGENYDLYPLEEISISFLANGTYTITTKTIFEFPTFSKEEIEKLYKRTKLLTEKYKKGIFPKEEMNFQEGLAQYYLLCFLNGIEAARADLIESKTYLDGSAAEWQSECLVILEKYEKTIANNGYK
ncbi:ATP-binding protein [Porifericola rhodea]|uniref:ATP-binding protein n=1 Tax=Porifericola rhodea TaxID=930972 RepID=UPI00266633E2|nr:ATP-binding protein [Porifericola rhodea]WKN32122.1 ATP-binding protein [Porifericola rhodea]